MLSAQLAALLDATPPGVDEALDLVTGFDEALVHGFGRLGPDRAAALTALAGALRATPLGPAMGEAAEKIAAGSVADEHLTVLAAGRTALLGAVHDAQLARFDTAVGRTRASWEEAPSPAASERTEAGSLLAGCRSWLHEVAITGWRGIDHDLVSTADQTLEALLAEPGLRRLAVLLDGLAAELRASCPVATMDRLPVRRWADLWTRALLLSQPGGLGEGAEEGAETVSGRLLILGLDMHEHSTAVQAQVHGILEPGGGGDPRLVRTSIAAAKVDTIVGSAVWQVLQGGRHTVLLTALAKHRSVKVADLPLLAGGDLVWKDDQVELDEPADPFATARIRLADALAPAVPPLDRHTVRICEPVLLEGYATDGHTVDLDGHTLAVDTGRLPAYGPLTPKLVAASTACIGLVRWDGGRWALQPLAVQATVKRAPVEVHGGDWALGPTDPNVVKAEARAGDTVTVLRERAGRLLRA